MPEVIEEIVTRGARRRAPRRRRRSRNLLGTTSTSKGPAPAVGEIQVEGPQVTTGVVQPVLHKNKGRIMKRGFGLNMTHELTPEEIGFMYNFLDPCGEHHPFDDNCKVPDAAFPNSAAIQFREYFTVKYPFSDATTIIDLTGQTWTLWMINFPFFRTSCVLIASVTVTELDSDTLQAFATAWNTTNDENLPRFPQWGTMGATENLYSVVEWSMLNGQPLPTIAGSPIANSFRFIADGTTCYQNAPTLVNQGMCVASQSALDIRNTELKELLDTGTGIELQEVYGYVMYIRNASDGLAVQLKLPGRTLLIQTVDSLDVGGTASVSFTETAAVDMLFAANLQHTNKSIQVLSGAAIVMSINISRTAASTYTFIVTLSSPAGTQLATNVANTTQLFIGRRYQQNQWYDISAGDVDESDGTPIKLVSFPPVNTDQMIQATPKAVALPLQRTKGVYQPIRVFQPQFNITAATQVGAIQFQVSGRTDGNYAGKVVGGKIDTADANFGVGVICLTGIAAGASPTFKRIRSVEVEASDTSLWQSSMHSNGPAHPRGIELARSVMDREPYGYPESYNTGGILGGLLGAIVNTVSKIPLIGDVVGVVRDVFLPKTPQASSTAAGQNDSSPNMQQIMAVASQMAQMLQSQMRS